MCSETACRAVNQQFQNRHTLTLKGHVRQAVVERCTFTAKGKVRANEITLLVGEKIVPRNITLLVGEKMVPRNVI